MINNKHILICCDLDRTLLPNGPQTESPQARKLFARLAQRPEVHLAYVSGRDKRLVLNAIEEYEIPIPDYVIGDVGTTIYSIDNNHWQGWTAWQEEISGDWNGMHREDLAPLLSDISELQLQEPEKQNQYKLSYYTESKFDKENILKSIEAILYAKNIKASLIWSLDELTNTGLLDVLPQSANKLHAINFLIQYEKYQPAQVIFAGDSGNDIPVLTSSIQSVIVNNALTEVKQQAIQLAKLNKTEQQLYLAKGGLLGMNGNYSAGILEGLVYYLPETQQWLSL